MSLLHNRKEVGHKTALVTFLWMALQFFFQLFENPQQ